MKTWAIAVIVLLFCAPSALASDHVVVQLKWYHGAQFAGVYAADQNGLSAEQDIDVSIREGAMEIGKVEALLSGDADFAIVSACEVLSRRSEEGAPIVAIAAIYQISPSVYFSKVERGIETPEDLAGARVLVYSGDQTLQPILGRFGLTLDDIVAVEPVVASDELPIVAADEGQMVSVFRNLIGNAIKFRAEESRRVHVGLRDRGAEWEILIHDNGIGIGPGFHDRIFVICQRLHGRDEHEGTGIGLALCRRIVERHSGRVRVESSLGEGATFFFTLPKEAGRADDRGDPR